MSYDARDIRKPMDVFTMDNAYLGTVRKVIPGEVTQDSGQVPETARQASLVNGEMLGPMPTRPLGNHGPRSQSATAHYATQADGAQRIGHGKIVVGKLGGLLSRRTISTDDVLSVSLERVVLKLKRDEL